MGRFEWLLSVNEKKMIWKTPKILLLFVVVVDVVPFLKKVFDRSPEKKKK